MKIVDQLLNEQDDLSCISMITLKGQSAKFLSFNMLIGALDGAHVQNLCSVPHFNPKL